MGYRLSPIPTDNGAESTPGWTKIQQMYKNVHSNLTLELFFERNYVECGNGLVIKHDRSIWLDIHKVLFLRVYGSR